LRDEAVACNLPPFGKNGPEALDLRAGEAFDPDRQIALGE
jgi:hypothetical protein